MNLLITIPFSHYCEKARWALDFGHIPYREEGHLPLLSRLATRPHGGRSVPLLVTPREVLRDSSDILAWVDAHAERRAEGALYPTDAAARADVLALEERFDARLGPHVRRYAYAHLLADKRLTDEFLASAPVPQWQVTMLRVMRPIAIAAIRRGLKITPASARRSEARVREVFASVDGLLAERAWLSGERFGAADLTFAALAGPLLLPPQHPLRQLARERLPDAMRALCDELAASRAGQHALRCYREARRP